ncbi:transporter substrate-binding domain-containing protein [Shewanella mesophila]|uniref:substrate-binding periplasmic protein n=1 Tax=Shewanella mesophila TaxID=2864208 RepID=UPI001C659023|nr:transporter substrate-binding domain-containing protein [Shewanella mesophila]QYJ87382.1 transporter substrate-binding domain-containing protein [Shewanella mesophila]
MKYKHLVAILVFLIYSLQAVANENKVVLACVDYPPYYGKSLENGGPFTEIIVQAYKKVGYEVKLRIVPWARGLKEAKEGTVDGIFTAWYRKDRERWFVFSEPLPPNEIVFYKRKEDNIKFNSFEDLKPYTVGVVRGYLNPPGFKEANLRTLEVTTDKQNLVILARNRIDLALTDKALGQYIIRTEIPEHANNLEWIDPPVEVVKQYLMISKQTKNFQKKVEAFNSGLKILSESGEMDKILAKHEF